MKAMGRHTIPMQARLRGALDGRVFDLPNVGEDYHRLLVGRAIEAKDERHVALPEVEETLSVSRRHAEVRRTATGGWEIADAGSRGGTRVDGRVVPQGVFVGLRNGSHVRLGNYDLIFELDPAAGLAADRSESNASASASGGKRRSNAKAGAGGRQMGQLADAHRHRILWLEAYPEDEEPKAYRLGLAVEGMNKTWLLGRRQNAEVDSERYPDARAVTLPDAWAQLSVSREHALVRFKSDGRLTIENLSGNGTVVRGRRLKKGQTSEIEFEEEFVLGTLPCSLRLGASAGEASTAMPHNKETSKPFEHLPSVVPGSLGFTPAAWSGPGAAPAPGEELPPTGEPSEDPSTLRPGQAVPGPIGQREPTESAVRGQQQPPPTVALPRKDNLSDVPPPPGQRSRRSSGSVRRPSRVDIAKPVDFMPPDPATTLAVWGYLVKPGEPGTRWALRSWRTRLGSDSLVNDVLVEGPLVQPQHAVLEWRRRAPNAPPDIAIIALTATHPVAVLPNGPKAQSPVVAGDIFVIGSQTFQLQVVGHPSDAPAAPDPGKSLFGWLKSKLG